MVSVRRIALSSMLIAIGGTMYLFESFVPFPVAFGKWGFSNFVVLLSAFALDLRATILIAAGKSLAGNLITGHLFDPVFFMSLLGSVSSGFVQFVCSRIRFLSLFAVSLIGSMVNNSVQALVGSMMVGSPLFLTLLPYMLVLGIPGAFINALVVKVVKEYVTEDNTGINFSEAPTDNENAVRRVSSNRSGNSRDL